MTFSLSLRRQAAAAVVLLVAGSACSAMKKGVDPSELSTSGPNVVDVHANPSTIELSRDYQPMQKSEVLAEVKDFDQKVTDVKLRFQKTPIELKMKHVGGTTWRAEVPTKVLQQLAVGNQTTKYNVDVVAKDSKGQVAISRQPVEIGVKAPNLSATG